MPIYIYDCVECDDEIEKNVPIEYRDGQYCGQGHPLTRKLVFTGSVWSNTANGGHKV